LRRSGIRLAAVSHRRDGAGRGARGAGLSAGGPAGTACVVVTPEVGVSTPKAFAEWDRKLTLPGSSDRMVELGRGLSAWLSESYSGAPFRRGRAENPLLELVRAGIKNDFEQVVFPEYPELSEGKSALERAGARCAFLSGSGSTLYGLFGLETGGARGGDQAPPAGLGGAGDRYADAAAYWQKFLVSSF